MDKFLYLYRKCLKYLTLIFSADAEALESTGYFSLDEPPIIRDKTIVKLSKRGNHDLIGANLINAINEVTFAPKAH